MQLKIRHAVLVYQAGLANVFAVDAFCSNPELRNARRLMQHAFRPCLDFARGLGAAGTVVRTAYCNEAGDIVNREWRTSRDDAPFVTDSNPDTPHLKIN